MTLSGDFCPGADAAARNEIELLINGGHVKKMVHQELAYRDLDSDIDNLWSILFTTGYLTQDGEDEDGISSLAILNREYGLACYKKRCKVFSE